MIRRLLATAATLAILISGATVGLEAVGLLFHGDAPRQMIASIRTEGDPLQGPEAILMRPLEALDRARLRRRAEPEQARRTADPYDASRQAQDEERYLADALRWAERYRQRREAERRLAALEQQPGVVGHDLTEAARRAEPKRARREADPYDAARQTQDEERYLADALRWAERHRQRREAEQWVTAIEPPQPVVERHFPEVAGQAERKHPSQETRELKPAGTAAEPAGERSSDTRVAVAAPPASSPPAECTTACRAESIGWQDNSRAVRPARPHRRPKANRANVRRGGSSGCPWLGWLHAVITPPAASDRANGRRGGSFGCPLLGWLHAVITPPAVPATRHAAPRRRAD